VVGDPLGCVLSSVVRGCRCDASRLILKVRPSGGGSVDPPIQRSKDVLSMMEACKEPLRCRSQKTSAVSPSILARL